ncbi:MAG: O-antigen ligase family protein [Tabrizicola sp.]|nr:O-antigen ligase family protein [Tabrizicola sp.]
MLRSGPTRATPVAAAKDFAASAIRLPWPVKFYLLMIYLPIEFNAGPMRMTGIRMMLILMIVPMLINLLRGKYGPVIVTDILFFLFCPWAIYTLSINNPDQAISFGGSVAVEFFGGYLLARAYIRSEETFIAMAKGLFFVIFMTLPFALFESQTGRALIPETINKLPFFFSLDDFYNELAGVRLGLERAQVIFAHPIHYGLFCSTAFALALMGFKGVYSNAFRYLVSFQVALGVFLSLSSGALLPMVIQIGLIVWAVMLKQVKARWLILLGLASVAYVVVDALSNRTPMQVFMSYATFSPHNAYWRALIFEWGMKNVWANPIVGLGLNEWVRPWFMHSGSMDNFWLLNAVRYGIPGFLLMAIGYAIPFIKIAFRRIDEASLLWQLRRAWTITLFGLALSLSTVDVWGTMFSFVAFILGSGIWMLTAQPSEVGAAATSEPEPERKIGWSRGQLARETADGASPYTRFSQSRTPPADRPQGPAKRRR